MFGNFESKNRAVGTEASYERDAHEGQVHMLILALDYKGTSCPLTCTMDGNNMQNLARASGVTDLEVMYDNQCTKENVERKIREIAKRTGPDDYFVFYYSGHGSSVPDKDDDEDDGQDEALCLVGPNGQLEARYFMTDDDFSDLMTDAFNEQTRLLIICDCCHSGTIGDFSADEWHGREAISISGCKDNQTFGDMGKGGIFTHSMLLALEHIKATGEEDFSVGALYNATLTEDDKVFKSEQDIQIRCTPSLKPNGMAWPLIPKGDYRSPLSAATASTLQQVGVNPQAQHLLGGLDDILGGQISQLLSSQPQLIASIGQHFGVNPDILMSVLSSGNLDLNHILNGGGEDYMHQLEQIRGIVGPILEHTGCNGSQCALM